MDVFMAEIQTQQQNRSDIMHSPQQKQHPHVMMSSVSSTVGSISWAANKSD